MNFWTGFFACTTLFFLGSGVSVMIAYRREQLVHDETNDYAKAMAKALDEQVHRCTELKELAAAHEQRAIAAHKQYVTALDELEAARQGLKVALENNSIILDRLRAIGKKIGVIDASQSYGEYGHGEEG